MRGASLTFRIVAGPIFGRALAADCDGRRRSHALAGQAVIDLITGQNLAPGDPLPTGAQLTADLATSRGRCARHRSRCAVHYHFDEVRTRLNPDGLRLRSEGPQVVNRPQRPRTLLRVRDDLGVVRAQEARRAADAGERGPAGIAVEGEVRPPPT